MSLCPERA